MSYVVIENNPPAAEAMIIDIPPVAVIENVIPGAGAQDEPANMKEKIQSSINAFFVTHTMIPNIPQLMTSLVDGHLFYFIKYPIFVPARRKIVEKNKICKGQIKVQTKDNT